MGKVRISTKFIKELESALTKPVFVRIWLSHISERYELSKELLQLLEEVPYERPSEEDGELLRDITQTYFNYRPFVYGIITSDLQPPLKFLDDSGVVGNHHIFAQPDDDATAEDIPLLYPESVERLLDDVIRLAFVKIVFAKKPPKKVVVREIPPSEEEVHRKAKELIREKNIFYGACNHVIKYLYKELTRTIEKKLNYETWELIGYEVNALREPLKELINANVKSYMEELKELIRRMGEEDPDMFLNYLHKGKTIMDYCIHPFDYYLEFGHRDFERYVRYVEDRFMKDFLDLKLEPEKADMSVIYRAIRDKRFEETAKELLTHIYKYVVKDNPDRKRLFVDILFKVFRSPKKVRDFVEKNNMDGLKVMVEGVIELKEKAKHLKKIHDQVIDLFTEEGFPEIDNPVVKKAYSAYINLLNKELLKHIKKQLHASFENLIWFFIDVGELEKAEALTKKAIELGVVSPMFIEITGSLGLKFFEKYSERDDVELLKRSLSWYDDFYELLYLEEVSGNLEGEIDIFPKIYENLNNYLSAKLFNTISEEVGSQEELDEEWEKLGERIEFIEGLFNKYGTKPYEKESVMVGDYLFVKVAKGEVNKERVFKFYLTTLKLYKAVYLLYSEEGEEEAKDILRDVISKTPGDILEDINLPEFFTNWGLDYEELLVGL